MCSQTVDHPGDVMGLPKGPDRIGSGAGPARCNTTPSDGSLSLEQESSQGWAPVCFWGHTSKNGIPSAEDRAQQRTTQVKDPQKHDSDGPGHPFPSSSPRAWGWGQQWGRANGSRGAGY